MKPFNLPKFFPCATFFTNGQTSSGCIALLMQATLVLWPVASRWAHEALERKGIETLLNELSEIHALAVDPYSLPAKKFRQLA